jgi:low affinity Fe/Cu permease
VEPAGAELTGDSAQLWWSGCLSAKVEAATRREGRRHVKTQPDDKSTWLTRSIGSVTGWLGSFPAIVSAVVLVVLWFIGGLFVSGHFANNTYQLLINTGTTIITFLMVFIIQNTQNRDGRAVQAKLDAQSEVLKAVADRLGVADDEDLLTKLVGVEDAPARVIKADQDDVRQVAVDSGRHGAARTD